MAAGSDQAQDGRRLGGIAKVIEQEARRLFVEDAERIENQIPSGRLQIGVILGQLPVSRDSAPGRIGLDSFLWIAQLQGVDV